MTDQPDLFAASREDATCAQCASYLRELSKREGFYCAISFQDARAEAPACCYYEERR